MATYRRTRSNYRLMGGMMATFSIASVVVIGVFVSGRIAGEPMPALGVVAFTAAWICLMNWMAFREFFVEPRAIHTSADGVRFEARWQPAEVRWADLQEVRSPLNDPFRQGATWKWNGGKRRTWTAYDGWHQLLAEVERSAPDAEIRGF